MTNDTCAQYPFIKNWFDHFRVCVHNLNASQIKELAIKHKCTIIHGNKSWNHNGRCVEVFNGKEFREFHEFLKKWQTVAKHRDVIVNGSDEKCALAKLLKEQDKLQTDFGKQMLEAKHTIMCESFSIDCNFSAVIPI